MRKILVSILIVILLLSTSCLSMIYYPARVLDKGKNFAGIGVNYVGMLDTIGNIPLLTGTVFYRRGLGLGFDAGVEMKSFAFIPMTITASARKEFNFNAIVIDGITIDAGYGIGYRMQEAYGAVSFLKGGFALTGAITKMIWIDADVNMRGEWWLANAAFCRASYEMKIADNFIFMPYLTFRYSEEYLADTLNLPYESLFTKVSEAGYYDMWINRKIGAGISMVFTF